MKKTDPRTIYLKDYKVPSYLIRETELFFDLYEDYTEVTSQLDFQHNQLSQEQAGTLVLDGEGLELLELRLDGAVVAESDWEQTDHHLTISNLPDSFVLTSRVKIYPHTNTLLEGLYTSSSKTGKNYCTQCEAEGFRRITWYLDRPDVMAVFKVTIEADKLSCPVLLSNGNPVAAGAEGLSVDLGNGRHRAVWIDPHPKPAYLFALVAGDYACLSDRFTTKSGRKVDLNIYTEPHNLDKTAHAMRSLINAMRWDEQRFGLEYDLDVYNIVATDDFNMGAMENKGLNIFNSKYVLASPESATDDDFIGIEAVIGHEYFHNWTGNRVTCRDWFQLSLKEGLTVYRDQEFTADMNSAAVKRIEDANFLRNHQYAEDAGPMAHPIRPPSYIEINNFYTLTVYEKGAQVVRIYQTLLGHDGFRKGMDLYFQRHDGQAVTTEDFLAAMADANNVDLSLMQRWYDQDGTPELKVEDSWDADTGEYCLSFTQHIPDTPGSTSTIDKLPVPIPLGLGLVDSQGNDIPLQQHISKAESGFLLTEDHQDFVFTGLIEKPVPSLLRGFSAPVKVEFDYSDEQLVFLAQHDSDPFNSWEAGQKLAQRVLLQLIKNIQGGHEVGAVSGLQHSGLQQLFAQTLHAEIDPALKADLLILPSESILADMMSVVDVHAVHKARAGLKYELGKVLETAFSQTWELNSGSSGAELDPVSMGQRKLKNVMLDYLLAGGSNAARNKAVTQLAAASCMTETMGALRPLAHSRYEEKLAALANFESRWHDDPLVLDKWFSIQASAPLEETLGELEKLMLHPQFSIKNPNRVRAVIGAFASANPTQFHRVDGSGYRFVSDQVIELNSINPMIAARLVKSFSRWRRYDKTRQTMMKTELERVLALDALSKDVYEIARKSLDG